MLAKPNQRIGAFLPPEDPGPGEFVALSLGPLAHASGQWLGLGTLLGGGHLRLYDEPSMDVTHVLELVEREHIGMVTLVGDATARPLLDELEAHPDRWDTSSLRLLGSGGSILSGDVKDGLLAAMPSVAVVARRHRVVRVAEPGRRRRPCRAPRRRSRSRSPRSPRRWSSTTSSGRSRPVPGVSVGSRRGAVHRSATTRIPTPPRARSSRSTESVGRSPATWHRRRRRRHPSARARLVVHQHRRREGVPGRGRGRAEDARRGVRRARRRRPGPEVGGTGRCGRPADRSDRASDGRRSRRALPRASLAGYKVPRAVLVVDAVRRNAAGKPDYAWAKTEAQLVTS